MEKTVDLKMPGVATMSTAGLKEVDGGNPLILLGPAIAIAIYMYDNRDRAIEGAKDAIKAYL
ncbi:hypothetical protein GM418_07940 [Maribellus comscasis]|uniref:Uncharacterized protein n=1 Tax=Maribellus comscasis TaxID=2681766 RepID=A0A6I6JWU5_9BACT|nr:hypothetical protein [Maribellus comscasis]QGY43593.1 hypothetical protein GM418_07940 [Maribellus comscasis]